MCRGSTNAEAGSADQKKFGFEKVRIVFHLLFRAERGSMRAFRSGGHTGGSSTFCGSSLAIYLMTTNSSRNNSQQPIPVTARLAILMLMAGVLVYGWQSTGVTPPNRVDKGLTENVSTASNGQAGPVKGDSRQSARATEGMDLRAEHDSPAVNSTDSIVLDITPLWVVVLIFFYYLLLRLYPAILQQTMSWLNDHGALLLASLAILLLFVSAFGFYESRMAESAAMKPEASNSDSNSKNQTFLHDIYQMLQLMNFNTEAGKLQGYLLLAGICAVLIAILAAREILQALFYDLLVRLQLLQASNHIVVCGLGRLGRQIIESLLMDRTRRHHLIVVLERDPQNPNLKWARQKGLLLVQGDGSETEDLQRIRLLDAHEVFLCAGADEVNISCLTAIRDLYQSAAAGAKRLPLLDPIGSLIPRSIVAADSYRPRCYAHIMNHDLLKAVRLFEQKNEQSDHKKSSASTGPSDGDTAASNSEQFAKKQASLVARRCPDIEIFSTPERTIWRLLTQLGRLQHAANGGSSSAGQRICSGEDSAPAATWHYILLGFGEFGRALAVSLAEQSHTQTCRRVRMTICDRDIQQGKRAFLSRYSQFCRPATGDHDSGRESASEWWSDAAPDAWTWHEETQTGSPLALNWVCRADFVDYHEVSDDGFLDQLIKRTSVAGIQTAVFVCFEDERENFTVSLRLKQKLQDRILQREFPKQSVTGGSESAITGLAPAWPIFAWLPRQLKLAKLVDEIEQCQPADKSSLEIRPRLMPFGQNYENVSYHEITRSWLDWLARLIHLVWQSGAPGSAQLQLQDLVSVLDANVDNSMSATAVNPWAHVFMNPWQPDEWTPERKHIDGWLSKFERLDWVSLEASAEAHWRSLENWERHSNRSAAIHAVSKAAALGLEIEGLPDSLVAMQRHPEVLYSVNFGKVRTLSEMEHNRWVAERLLDGWWWHRERSSRTRRQLTPFRELQRLPLPKSKTSTGPEAESDSATSQKTTDERGKDARIIMLLVGLIATGRLKTKPLQPTAADVQQGDPPGG